MARNDWTHDGPDDYSDDDSYDSTTECFPTRPARELTESEWIDENFDEVSAMYSSLKEYVEHYGPCMLQTLTFDAFATFVYQHSYHTV
jgi:hypothetical protein